jgi:cystathionine beta-lyase/cystathionine gamma-synthase
MMITKNTKKLVNAILENMPIEWISLTTHRLDIYNENQAKTEFLVKLENLVESNNLSKNNLDSLPTAFDYIRLGHPLSCTLEWIVSKSRSLNEESVISFSSETMPILAILRKNLLSNVKTQIVYKSNLPLCFDGELIKKVYGYNFDLIKVESFNEISNFEGSTIVITELEEVFTLELEGRENFIVGTHQDFGSIVLVNGQKNQEYISEIQHVRRRESIAMTPQNCLTILEGLSRDTFALKRNRINEKNKQSTLDIIREITSTTRDASLGSCGLSIQYAIMMGLVQHSMDKYPGKSIKFIVPPNCYGGTNDQARRVAACVENVEILDLPVDSGKDMVSSVERILDEVASIDAVPFIIAEIPTNPRVEVPDLVRLKDELGKIRKNLDGDASVSPVFILDQTFCPNVKFLGEGDFLSTVKTISYVSGSKFPSGGLCTAGYCVANNMAQDLMNYVDVHLKICSNEATGFQIDTLSKQMTSMNERIASAYRNTREFVNHIKSTLPGSKINFVSEELALAGFTPSVFSLDLPTQGNSSDEKEAYKRDLNLKLIDMMIKEIPSESKHCVSYGQLKGCYWTIPATSTQGTTKEGDKDYIVRVSIAPDFNLELHNKTFSLFCEKYIN